jgi:hypothetical protein
MAIFNSRIRIFNGREWQSEPAGGNVHISLASSPHHQSAVANGVQRSAQPPIGSVHVREEVWVHTDTMEMTDVVSRWLVVSWRH